MEGTFRHKNTLYSKDDITVDNQFVLDTPEAFYLVVFNYDKFGNSLDYRPDFKRIGADPADFASVKELWTGEIFADPAKLAYTIPSKDVRIFSFEKK